MSDSLTLETPLDPRAKRTRDALGEGLMRLLRQKDWHDISTAAICREAGVARSSFYEHFKGKGALLDAVFESQLAAVCPPPGAKDGPLCTLDWLMDHVWEAPEFLQTAMNGSYGATLLPRFRAAVSVKLAEELTARGISRAPERAAFIIGGALSVLGLTKTPEDVAALRPALHHMAQQLLG